MYVACPLAAWLHALLAAWLPGCLAAWLPDRMLCWLPGLPRDIRGERKQRYTWLFSNWAHWAGF